MLILLLAIYLWKIRPPANTIIKSFSIAPDGAKFIYKIILKIVIFFLQSSLHTTDTTGIQRVQSLEVLGVLLQSDLSFSAHIKSAVTKGNQCLYALKTRKTHGMSDGPLFDVARSTLIPSLTYASPAWWGFASIGDKSMLQAVLNKAIRWGLYGVKNPPELAQICTTADMDLFKNVIKDTNQVLYNLLPPKKTHNYNLRTRFTSTFSPLKMFFRTRIFWIGCYYVDMYWLFLSMFS